MDHTVYWNKKLVSYVKEAAENLGVKHHFIHSGGGYDAKFAKCQRNIDKGKFNGDLQKPLGLRNIKKVTVMYSHTFSYLRICFNISSYCLYIFWTSFSNV